MASPSCGSSDAALDPPPVLQAIVEQYRLRKRSRAASDGNSAVDEFDAAARSRPAARVGDILAKVDSLLPAVAALSKVLAAAPHPEYDLASNAASAERQRHIELKASVDAIGEIVDEVHVGIRSTGSACVKRAVRDMLLQEIADRERILRSIETAVAIAKNMLL